MLPLSSEGIGFEKFGVWQATVKHLQVAQPTVRRLVTDDASFPCC